MPEKSEVQIFLAHASEDKPQVRELYRRLKDAGYRPWMDEMDLLPGQAWREEIPKALQQSNIFIACLSQQSVAKKGYIQREFRLALNQCADLPPGTIYIIPLKFDDCEIPDLQQAEYDIKLRDYHWLAYRQTVDFEQLVAAIELQRGQSGSTGRGQPTSAGRDRSPIPESQKRISWYGPELQNRLFVGRSKTLEHLHSQFEQHKIQVLHGLGGMGKTTLALEYAKQHKDKPYNNIFWFPAGDEVSLRKWLVRILERLGKTANWVKFNDSGEASEPTKEDDWGYYWRAFSDYLKKFSSNTKQLIVFDNVDGFVDECREEATDPERFLDETKALRHFSNLSNIKILITSRFNKFDKPGRIISTKLKEFSQEESLLFFVGRLKQDRFDSVVDETLENVDNEVRRVLDEIEHEALINIIDELGGLPLALEQAASYFFKQSRCGFREYLDRFRKEREKDLETLMKFEAANHTLYDVNDRKDRDDFLAVTTTWKINFSLIERTGYCEGSAACELIEYASLLAPDNIPISIFIYGDLSTLGGSLARLCYDCEGEGFNYELRQLLDLLSNYSLITWDAPGGMSEESTFSIHRVLQKVIRLFSLDEQNRQVKFENLLKHASAYLQDMWNYTETTFDMVRYAAIDYGSWIDSRNLFPHIREFILRAERSRSIRNSLKKDEALLRSLLLLQSYLGDFSRISNWGSAIGNVEESVIRWYDFSINTCEELKEFFEQHLEDSQFSDYTNASYRRFVLAVKKANALYHLSQSKCTNAIEILEALKDELIEFENRTSLIEEPNSETHENLDFLKSDIDLHLARAYHRVGNYKNNRVEKLFNSGISICEKYVRIEKISPKQGRLTPLDTENSLPQDWLRLLTGDVESSDFRWRIEYRVGGRREDWLDHYALALLSQGCYLRVASSLDGAEKCLSTCVSLVTYLYGTKHSSIAERDLAKVYRSQGGKFRSQANDKFNKAKSLLDLVQKRLESNEEHRLDVARCYTEFGRLCRNWAKKKPKEELGLLKEALKYHSDAYDVYSDVFPNDQPIATNVVYDLSKSYSEYIQALSRRKKTEAAKDFSIRWKQTLDELHNAYAELDPSTFPVEVSNLGSLYSFYHETTSINKDLQEAERWLKKSLGLLCEHSQDNLKELNSNFKNLARLYKKQAEESLNEGDYGVAFIKLAGRVSTLKQQDASFMHASDRLNFHKELGDAHRKLADVALQYLNSPNERLNKNQPEISDGLISKNRKDALSHFRESLVILVKALDGLLETRTNEVTSGFHSLGAAYLECDMYEPALICFNAAKVAYERLSWENRGIQKRFFQSSKNHSINVLDPAQLNKIKSKVFKEVEYNAAMDFNKRLRKGIDSLHSLYAYLNGLWSLQEADNINLPDLDNEYFKIDRLATNPEIFSLLLDKLWLIGNAFYDCRRWNVAFCALYLVNYLLQRLPDCVDHSSFPENEGSMSPCHLIDSCVGRMKWIAGGREENFKSVSRKLKFIRDLGENTRRHGNIKALYSYVKNACQIPQYGIQSLEDLKGGPILDGIIVSFNSKLGAFIDIGIYQDGLAHISTLKKSKKLEVGRSVTVKADVNNSKINLLILKC